LEKAFGRVLTSHVEDLAKSKFQDDLEGTFRSWMLISLKKRSSNLPYVSSQYSRIVAGGSSYKTLMFYWMARCGS
jgi:hypothetical protein